MGYKVNGTTIQITRGDSGYFQFTPYTVSPTGERTEYVAQEGDMIRFAMKKKLSDSYEVLLTKEVDPATFQIKLDPADTEGLAFGAYYYDVQLTTAGGDVDTYIPETGKVAEFIIEKGVD